MSYEPGSPECRSLIEAKENIISAMKALNRIQNLEHIQKELKKIYNELEELHESRRIKELNC